LKKIKICVVGVGHWGSNHVKTLLSMNISVGCIDKDFSRLSKMHELDPSIKSFSSIEESFEHNFSGYILATPASTHTELAKTLISNHKPVLIEKPLALSLQESKQIKSYVDKFAGKVVVGHLLLFHPAINKIKTMIDDGKIGKIQYMYSNRLNLGKVRREENVFWSFAPHDISVFQYLSSSFPSKTFSIGGDFLQKKIHDTTITYLKYPNNIQGHIYVSWLHPFKEHRLVVIGTKGTLHFEDSIDKKPIQFYEKQMSKNDDIFTLKNKKPININYGKGMPLKNELKYFIDVINGKTLKKANIDEGIDVVRILETSSKSLSKV